MSNTSYGPPWSRGYQPGGYRPRNRRGYSDPDLRVGDAERSDVADRLSRHYADGRLDQSEFNDRLDRAMSAKTRSDLGGLFHDLPMVAGTDVETRQRRSRPHIHRFLFLLIMVAIAAAVVQNFVQHSFRWVVVGVLVLVLLWLRYSRWHHHS